ncbi:helix-turn-helix domain-containing protein [Acidaminococcus intestini]|uniref:Toxin-antitoxin system, antitoxin component, Xre family n=1 Tax=Acidaminococcus intestini (strain RyC-MR95) TaxID=568816 RepID=G4Q2H0_ACIIR|nr:helix-turn-helix transcriptional regulator [Acidaminococcus intestini]AEQ22626.1 toxin-antitoxin system, antitoxin component, Xre family [Acidaminococcus intestini RyC-MR95]
MPTPEEAMALFSKRLSALLNEHNINQAELAKKLGVSESTVGKWLLMKSLPRMGIIQKLSELFQVSKSYFLEEIVDDRRTYYLNPETAELAEQLRTNAGLRMLFKASADLDPDKMKEAYNYVQYLKSKEPK